MSTDYIGANYEYPDGDYSLRASIYQRHVAYTKGLLWYLGHSARVPEQIRKEMLKYGYPKDEYTDNGGFTHELYVREARRMIGEMVMTESHCTQKEKITDGIAWGAYNMDSHHTQRLIIDGNVHCEGEVTRVLDGPYPISYRALLPKSSECTNLMVPVCTSASHTAYGSIRMEPVYMAMSQAAGVAVSMALDEHKSVQEVNVNKLQEKLITDPLLNGTGADVVVDLRHKSTHMTIKGLWKDSTEYLCSSRTKFWYSHDSAGTDRSIVFYPKIEKEDWYSINTYVPRFYKPTGAKVPVLIKHAYGQKTVVVDIDANQKHDDRLVHLGIYRMEKGSKGYIKFEGKGVKTPMVVCNVVLIPVMPH